MLRALWPALAAFAAFLMVASIASWSYDGRVPHHGDRLAPVRVYVDGYGDFVRIPK